MLKLKSVSASSSSDEHLEFTGLDLLAPSHLPARSFVHLKPSPRFRLFGASKEAALAQSFTESCLIDKITPNN